MSPAADALRIISDTGQNLRFSFLAGTTTVDGPLTYPPATIPATGVTGAAYTNNDADPNTATTLYDLDTTRDLLVRQNPPNAGGLETVGPLGFPAGAPAGFDIVATPGGEFAFAALNLDRYPLTVLFQVDLTTGQAQPIGVVSPAYTLRGITA